MKRLRLASKLTFAIVPIALVALLAGGYVAWTFLSEAAAQDDTAHAATVASDAMIALRTLWSEEYLANAAFVGATEQAPAAWLSFRGGLDNDLARLKASVATLPAVSGVNDDTINRTIRQDIADLEGWLATIRSTETISAEGLSSYQAAGELLLSVIGQSSLYLDDRTKARDVTAAQAMAEASLISSQQERLVRNRQLPGSSLTVEAVEQSITAREVAFWDRWNWAKESSPAAAAVLATLDIKNSVVDPILPATLEINNFESDRNEVLIVAAEGLAKQVTVTASSDANLARIRALEVGGGVAVILLLATAGAARIGRSLVRRVRYVTDSAKRVTEVDLPNLVKALRNPQGPLEGTDPVPIKASGHDEVGELANSFSALHGTLVTVARQQMEILRKGVSDIFVTLARRNSSLVDRQLALIDTLESREENPETLGGYYKLDHLATRMRRNAESLLVLAGTETPRMWSKSLEIGDVVRAALGEVDEYQRVDVLALEPVQVAGNVVADISHLLSELLDNATQFSAPTDRVRVAALFDQDGYLITVSDRGMGMSEVRMAELNELLSKPPVVGLALEPTLGLYVVARLAARHGISVRIVAGVPGVTVRITVPRTLLEVQVTKPAVLDPGPRQPVKIVEKAPTVSAPETANAGETGNGSSDRSHRAYPWPTPERQSAPRPPQVVQAAPAPPAVAVPKHRQPSDPLPVRVPGISFNGDSNNPVSSTPSERAPADIKSVLSTYQAVRDTVDRSNEPTPPHRDHERGDHDGGQQP